MSSDESVSAAESVCPVCGFPVPAGRYCSNCGHALDGPGSRRLYGVLAPGPTFVLACLALVGGLLALIAGSPVAAIVLVVISVTAFVLFYGAAQRDPSSRVGRRVMIYLDHVRGWGVFSRESVAAWARAAPLIARARHEAGSLRRERKRVLPALGEATYREDDATMEALRVRLRQIDEALAECGKAQATALEHARHRVREERIAVQPTQQYAVEDLTTGGDTDS